MSEHEIIHLIRAKVEELQSQGLGGEAFFDAIDSWMGTEEASPIWPLVFSQIPAGLGIVLTGGSGRQIVETLKDTLLRDRFWVLYAGGVRSGAKPEVLDQSTPRISLAPSNFVMVDDSIYGGKTFTDIAADMMKRFGIKVLQCYVVYDGCPKERGWVKPTFRYYDFFVATPNHKF